MERRALCAGLYWLLLPLALLAGGCTCRALFPTGGAQGYPSLRVLGQRAHGVGVIPTFPSSPSPGVVPTGESEPGRGDGGWEGSTQLFLCRESQTERRSGAAGNAVTRGRPVPWPVGRSPAHPLAVRCIGAAAPRTTHSGERLAPSLENPRVLASGTRIGLLNFFVRKENLSGSVGLRQHAWFNGLLVRGPPRAVPPPGGALPVPAALGEEVGAG